MSYEIIGETIKSATSIKIGDIFKVATNQTDNQGNTVYTYPKRYKEPVSRPTYPNFFISQVNLDVSHKGKDRLQLDYLINVRYRVAEDLSNITNINQQLDEIGLKLCSQLTELDLELPTKTKNRRYEKDDGVLQFFFNITVFAYPETEDKDKFKELELNEEVI